MTTVPLLTTPPVTPAPLGNDLLVAATVRAQADPRARNGVQFTPTAGVEGGFSGVTPNAGTLAAPLVPEDWTALSNPDGYPIVQTLPFAIYAGVKAKPIGVDFAALQQRAKTKLALTASRWIEKAVWSRADDPAHLAAAGTTELAAAAVSPAVAIGLIEQWLGDTVGAQGIVHAPRLASGILWNQVQASGGKWTTRLGCPVAFGAGYPNTAPGDVAAAANVVWLYATGPMLINRSGIEAVPEEGIQGFDRPSNTAETYAVEIVSVGYEAGVAAVPVQLT